MPRPFAQVDVFGDGPVAATRSRSCSTARARRRRRCSGSRDWTNLSETTFVLPPPSPAPTTACGSSRRSRSCRSPGTRRSAPATPGSSTAARRARRAWSCRSAAPAWSGSAGHRGRLAFAGAAAVRSGPVDGRAARADRGDRSRIDARRDRRQPVGRQRAGLGRGAAGERRRGARRSARRLVDLDSASSGRTRRRRGAFEVRAFFPSDGATVEDPVTGSLNASLADWLLGRAGAGALRRRAGHRARPPGPRARHAGRDGAIWIGGGTRTTISGSLSL